MDLHAALEELVVRDPRCFYMTMDACLRCNASTFHGAARFIHPSTAAVLNRKRAAGENNISSSSRVQAQGRDSSSSSTTSGSPGTGAGGGLLDDWKQTQAYLSALLSYRKVMHLLGDSAPALDVCQWNRGLRDAVNWFIEEGMLDALGEPGAAKAKGGKKSSSSSAGSAEATAADPEEAAACRMLALCVLSRVLITFCQQLAGVGNKGSRGSSSSSCPATGPSGGAGVSSILAAVAEQLKRIDSSEENMSKRLQLGCSLGVACYCLMKQVQQYGSSSSRSNGKAESSTSKRSSKGSSSRGKGGGESSATALGTNSSSKSQKWGGLQLELPPSVLERLQEFEGQVSPVWLGGEYALIPARYSQKTALPLGESVLVLGSHKGAIEVLELLELLLGLCEGVVAAVPVPLGCNNPSCSSLDGVSEASAAKVCSGCKKAHYCGTACVKAHWKEHKPYCK